MTPSPVPASPSLADFDADAIAGEVPRVCINGTWLTGRSFFSVSIAVRMDRRVGEE